MAAMTRSGPRQVRTLLDGDRAPWRAMLTRMSLAFSVGIPPGEGWILSDDARDRSEVERRPHDDTGLASLHSRHPVWSCTFMELR